MFCVRPSSCVDVVVSPRLFGINQLQERMSRVHAMHIALCTHACTTCVCQRARDRYSRYCTASARCGDVSTRSRNGCNIHSISVCGCLNQKLRHRLCFIGTALVSNRLMAMRCTRHSFYFSIACSPYNNNLLTINTHTAGAKRRTPRIQYATFYAALGGADKNSAQ